MICESPEFLCYYYKTRTKEVSSQIHNTILNNKKYLASETTAYLGGIATAYVSMKILKDMSINEDAKILLGLSSKSLGWTIVNYLTIKSIEQFENKKEHLSQKDMGVSNVVTFAIGLALKYGFSKYMIDNGIEPENAVVFSTVIGTIPTFMRHHMNFKSNVIRQVTLEERI